MFNKNLIVGLVVVVLLGGGVAYYFLNGSNNASTNTPAPVTNTKTGELTRELAKQIAWEQLKAKPIKAGELKDVTITGVSIQNKTTAMVNMTVEYEGTPSVEITMPFALYDDGWGSFGW